MDFDKGHSEVSKYYDTSVFAEDLPEDVEELVKLLDKIPDLTQGIQERMAELKRANMRGVNSSISTTDQLVAEGKEAQTEDGKLHIIGKIHKLKMNMQQEGQTHLDALDQLNALFLAYKDRAMFIVSELRKRTE